MKRRRRSVNGQKPTLRHLWVWLRDSYRHYRRHVGLGRVHAFYRAVYFEARGKEPYFGCSTSTG